MTGESFAPHRPRIAHVDRRPVAESRIPPNRGRSGRNLRRRRTERRTAGCATRDLDVLPANPVSCSSRSSPRPRRSGPYGERFYTPVEIHRLLLAPWTFRALRATTAFRRPVRSAPVRAGRRRPRRGPSKPARAPRRRPCRLRAPPPRGPAGRAPRRDRLAPRSPRRLRCSPGEDRHQQQSALSR